MIDSTKMFDQLHDVRTVVLMETDPQSDEYVQIMLTSENRRKMLDLLESFMVHNEQGFVVPAKERLIPIPDAQDDFTQAEIDSV